MRLAEPGQEDVYREAVLSPEAAVLCQAGRVVSDAVPKLCPGGRAATQASVCFCAKSSPTPCPDHCLVCLYSHAQTVFLFQLLPFSFSTSLHLLHKFTAELKGNLAFVGEMIIA